ISVMTVQSDKAVADGQATDTVLVTVKDANNNPVGKQMVTLSGDSVMKFSAPVTTDDKGVATFTVTSTTSGSFNVKAKVDSSGAEAMGSVTFVAGSPSEAMSAIKINGSSYTAGDHFEVTVTLKDAHGNAVIGQASLLTNSAVTLPNTQIFSNKWVDHNDGTYIASNIYQAKTVGSGLKATLKIDGWSNVTESSTYDISANTAAQANSKMVVDKSKYVVGEDVKVTVTLRDLYDNVPSDAESFAKESGGKLGSAVFYINGTLADHDDWEYKGNGVWVDTTPAVKPVTNEHAHFRMKGWSSDITSDGYTIKMGVEAPESINTQVNKQAFAVSSVEGTFPTTGFSGATFTLVPKNNRSVSDYTWVSDANWVSVTDGVVKFTGTGAGSKVTITGVPTNGHGNTIKYSFTLSSWFKIGSASMVSFDEANLLCTSTPGYSLPQIVELVSEHRMAGTLWGEWGAIGNYPGMDVANRTLFWSSSPFTSGDGIKSHEQASLLDGAIFHARFSKLAAICRAAL
ncbi:Ig-like domain-containing protein, partial [Pantoea agglomerans]